MDSVLNKELELSQHCLQSNPKSYGAWHHRGWCLTRMAKPNWRREIDLCDQYLTLDERNFHCWDHRFTTFQRLYKYSMTLFLHIDVA